MKHESNNAEITVKEQLEECLCGFRNHEKQI